MGLIWFAGRIKPSRVNPEARDVIARVILGWVAGPDRVTEVADTLAGMVARFASSRGGWHTVADQYLMPGPVARHDFAACYRLLYYKAADFDPSLI